MDELAVVAVVGEAELDRVRAAAPLAVDLLLQCGPALLPTSVAACTADAEGRHGSDADALRSALAADPWAGMGSLAKSRWLLAAASSAVLVFVNRVGEVGVGQVLVLRRAAERWEPAALSGAGRLVPGGDRSGARVESVLAARPCASGVELEWIGDGDLDGVPQRRVDEVRVAVEAAAVHVLVITVPLAAPDADGGGAGGSRVTGVGVRMRAVVELSPPLGTRSLLDDSRLPAVRVAVEPRLP